MTQPDFDNLNSRALRNTRIKLVTIERKAIEIIETNKFVNPETFNNLFTSRGNYKHIYGLFDYEIERLLQNDQIGTAESYKNAKSSLHKFGGNLLIGEITPDLLKKYQAWMYKQRRSNATIGIYLRTLRAILNKAVALKLLHPDQYPFGKNRYQIPTGSANHRALSIQDKNKLLLYTTPDPEKKLAVDFFKFSYFCNGINMADILQIRYACISENQLFINRLKVQRTARAGRPIIIPLRAECLEVIRVHGVRSLDPNAFVFPVLNDSLSPAQVRHRVKDFTKKVNKGLNLVCNELGLPRVTTYAARHTFASVALQLGVSKEFIQDALGHSSMAVTESYLSGFDSDTRRAVSDKL